MEYLKNLLLNSCLPVSILALAIATCWVRAKLGASIASLLFALVFVASGLFLVRWVRGHR
jgi:hypothetical protein